MQNNIMIINRNYQDINPLQVGSEDCAPSHSYGPTIRTYYLIHYVVSGKGRFCCPDKEYCLGAGDLFLIPPDEVMFYQADQKQPWSYIWVGFESVLPLADLFARRTVHAPESKKLFDEMKNCHQYGEMAEMYVCSKIFELLALLKGEERLNSTMRYALQAKNIIETQYDRDLSVNYLCDVLGLERSYFSKIFKQVHGVSPQQYLVSFRLSKAAELMRCQHCTPSQAAAYCGYTDLINFSKMFKKQFGLPPRHYFNQYKEFSDYS